MISGILIINKEAGYTSHDVVAKLRGITKQKKIGHTGTLDPDATGVLPICFGKATKVSELLTNKEKVYVTTLLLGRSSDTQDSSGKIISEGLTAHLTEDEVKSCIKEFIGELSQVPPMYSALKVNGKKLYELAREGKEVDRKPRNIVVQEINILWMDLPRVKMEIKCSKGTYIRTLCHDIGEKLGCGGLMEDLVRTKVGDYTIENSITIDEFAGRFRSNLIDSLLLKIEDVFEEYPKFNIKKDGESLAYNGNPLSEKLITQKVSLQNRQRARLYDFHGNFIGIYQWIDGTEGEGRFKPEKLFFDN
jgi:tRNA pseudouridine55 synthase